MRFLASTSADLRARVEARAFRADLFYRLGAVEIAVPALRERREDIPLLARHLLEKHAQRLERPVPALREEAVRLLSAHDWPGNVRELEAVLLRALVTLSRPETLGAGDLEPFLAAAAGARRSAREPLFDEKLLEGRRLEDLKRELERAYLLRLFRKVRGDLRKMMAALGVKQSHLYSWLKKAGIDVRALREGRG